MGYNSKLFVFKFFSQNFFQFPILAISDLWGKFKNLCLKHQKKRFIMNERAITAILFQLVP